MTIEENARPVGDTTGQATGKAAYDTAAFLAIIVSHLAPTVKGKGARID